MPLECRDITGWCYFGVIAELPTWLLYLAFAGFVILLLKMNGIWRRCPLKPLWWVSPYLLSLRNRLRPLAATSRPNQPSGCLAIPSLARFLK